MPDDRVFSDDEVDAAIGALNEPGRLSSAIAMVGRTAPQLQHILAEALQEGGFFGQAHEDELRKALEAPDPSVAVRTLVAEETRLGMLIGVAVGYELHAELSRRDLKED